MADYGEMFYGTLPQDTQDMDAVLRGVGRSIRDIGRGVSYYPYDLIGAPVDLINMALNPVGLGSEEPVMGSDYLRNIARSLGLAEAPTGSGAETAARFAAGFTNPASGARAVGRASDLVTRGANVSADKLVQMITQNPEATAPAVLEAAGEMAPLSRIFVGRRSPLWDTGAADEAVALEQAGVNPREIWNRTLTGRDETGDWKQEVSLRDMQVNPGAIPSPAEGPTNLSSAVTSGELFGTYPDLFGQMRLLEETTPGLGGSYNRGENLLTLRKSRVKPDPQGNWNVDEPLTTDELRQIIAHEGQHGIQSQENWATGGNIETVARQAEKTKKAELAPLVKDRAVYRDAFTELVNADRALYMHKLSNLSRKDNIKPREIFSMSDWYKYGTDYRREVGPMPKKAGAARDMWLNNAAGSIRAKTIEEKPFLQFVESEFTVKDAKNAVARANRKIEKVRGSELKARELMAKYKNIASLDPYEQYKLLYGEAEARLAADRLDLTDQEMRSYYPFEMRSEENPYGLDVDPKQTFSYRRDYSLL